MAGRLKIKLIFLITAVLFVSAFLATPVKAADANGLSVSRNGVWTSSPTVEAIRGELVTVYINIPALPNHSDAVWMKVYYDPTVFELPDYWASWGTLDNMGKGVEAKTGYGYDEDGAFFSFAASAARNDGGRLIPVWQSQCLEARLRVRSTAKLGDSVLKLQTHDVAYTNDDGATYTDMWDSPACTEATVTVTPPSSVFKTGGGIRAEKDTVALDNEFYIYIDVPRMEREAVMTDIEVGYDPSAFTFLGWETYAYAGVQRDQSHFGISRNECIHNTTLRAKMRVKKTAKGGKYTFVLTAHSLHYDDGITTVEMWSPDRMSVDVTVLDTSSFPSDNYGISVYPVRAKPRETFDVYVTVPPMDSYAKKIDIRVEYDRAVFELVSWQPEIGVIDNGWNWFGLKAENTNIDLRSGLSFKARMRSSANARDSYAFTLTHRTLSNEFVSSMWDPQNATAYIYISDTGPGEGNDPKVTVASERVPSSQAPVTTKDPRVTVSDADTTRPVNSSDNIHDDDDDEIYNNGGTGNGGDSGSGGNSDEDTVIYNGNDDDTTVPASRGINIYLDAILKGIAERNIDASTKKKFFSGDTVIMMRNTDEAETSARAALRSLDLSGHRVYSFDVSVRDMASGTYIHDLGNGYIDLTMPVPDGFAGGSSGVALYHIVNGSPERVDGTVSVKGGRTVVAFRVKTFSPYMFVDLTNVDAAASVTTERDYTPAVIVEDDVKGESPRTNDTNANPHTGVIIAVTLPAALIGCVLLTRKGKRKRSSRR